MSICITNSVRGGLALSCTPEKLDEARNSSLVAQIAEEVKDLTRELRLLDPNSDEYARVDKLKKQKKLRLPALIPHASSFDDFVRKNEKAHPSGLVFFDIDHYEGDLKAFYEEKIADFKEMWNIALVEMSISGDGMHILFVKPLGMTVQQAQQWMSEQLGVKFDEGTFDLARASFCVPQDHVFYQDDDLLFNELIVPEDELQYYKTSDKKPSQKAKEEVKAATEVETLEVEAEEPSDGSDLADSTVYTESVFDSCMNEADLSKDELDIPGVHNWHNNLKAILSVGACQLMSKNQLLAVVKKRMPNYFDTDDCKRLIDDFYKNYTDENARMTLTLRRIHSKAQKAAKDDFCSLTQLVSSPIADSSESKDSIMNEGAGAPKFPTNLPPLIAHLLKNVPDMYKPAVANAIFPSLAAHLHGVKFMYVDNQEMEPAISTLLVAKSGIGKGAVNNPIENIIRDFKEHDEDARKRIQQWKDECQKCSDKERKPLRPKDIYIQVPENDMTSAALVQLQMDLQNNGERCLYQKMDEVELLNGISSKCSADRLICLGYDRAPYGAERVSANSVSGNPPLRWNWNASTTPIGARNFFRKSLINGTFNRLNICTIFKPAVKRDKDGKRKRSLPVFGTYDEAFYEELKPYIDNLNAASGLIVSEDVNKTTLSIIDNCEDMLDELNDDAMYDSIWHRACTIGHRKAMTLYIASGYVWTKEMSDFIKWSVEYDLWVKMYYFHEDVRKALEYDQMHINANFLDQRHTVLSLFAQLPDEFTTSELVELRVKNGQSKKVNYVTSRWKKAGYITPLGRGRWKKLVNDIA